MWAQSRRRLELAMAHHTRGLRLADLEQVMAG